MAWLTLFLVKISVSLGLEGKSSNGLIIGNERNFLSRLMFFCGHHEVILLWCTVIVKLVVNITLIGGDAGHTTREKGRWWRDWLWPSFVGRCGGGSFGAKSRLCFPSFVFLLRTTLRLV
ncbi:Uncharacterized protein Rs2_09940 [Raphanus sativus]|nr:Uncharacterized protein Rs2_09940 [Raphanus sativus]